MFLFGLCILSLAYTDSPKLQTNDILIESSQLQDNVTLPFTLTNTTYKTSGSILLTNGYIFNYSLSHDSLDIYLYSEGIHWFGLGFGKSMHGSDMIVVEIKNKSAIIVSDMYDQGDGLQLDEDLGGTNNIYMIDSSISSKGVYVHLRRKLKTGDIYDAELTDSGDNDLIWIYSPNTSLDEYSNNSKMGFIPGGLALHEPFIALEYKDQHGMTKSVFKTWLWLHGIFEFIAWGIVAEIGSYFVRYFRHWNKYLLAHSICFWIVLFPSIIWTIIAIFVDKIYNDDNVGYWTGNGGYILHFTAGISLMILGFVEHFGGLAYYLKIRSYDSTEKITIMKYSHMILGYILLALSKFITLRGTWLASATLNEGKTMFWVLVGFYCINFFVRIKLEKDLRDSNSGKKRNITQNKAPLSFDQKALLNLLNTGYSFHDILAQLPKIKWCLYGNKVLDVTDYIHPAGNYMIKECWGKEIGRYIFGGFALETTQWVSAHKHSKWAIDVIDSLTIGEFVFYDDIIVGKSLVNQKGSGSCIISIKPKPSIKEPIRWALVSKENLSDSVSKFTFQSPNFKVLNSVHGVKWMGRHFNLYFADKPGVKRQYTTILCMTDENIKFRKAVIDYFDSVTENNIIDNAAFVPPTDIKKSKNCLPFIIKRYEKNKGFSSLLHEVECADDIKKELFIEGPIGTGLELSETSAGLHILFAAGTGLLPFLDLLNYLLMKVMYETLKAKGLNAEAMNINGEDYENTFDKSFRVEMYSAFSTPKEIVSSEILVKLSEYSQKYKKNFFKSVMRKVKLDYNETINENFTSEWIQKNIPLNATRILICGPPNFSRKITKSLRAIGYSFDKILFV